MERCPNCGQMGRPGARFCTICGYRIVDDAGDGETAVMEDREPPPTGETNDLASGATSAGWPAPPADDPSPGFAAWTAEIPVSDSGETAPSIDEAANEEYASVWSARSGDDWPGPPATNAADTEVGDPTTAVAAPPSDEAIAVEVETISERIEAPPLDTDAQERAVRLLDEVREIIATMTGASPLDLSGVIAELEVAVTPPGAINADDLSALREALLAARERPRDLDTIVDLTARIDAMVALVFAYDRAIAAIERALDVLRRG